MMHRLLSIDNQLFREGLKRLLVGTDFQLAGEADNLGDAYCRLKEQPENDRRIDLIATALDDSQPVDNVEWLRQFRGLVPNARILVLANTSRPVPLSSDLLSQIDGYLSKDVSAEILLHSLQLMVLGQQVLPGSLEPPQVQATPATQRSPGVVRPGALSPREAEIMRLIVSGHSNKQIAKGLNISDATVKVHMKSLLRKMRANNRTQAAIWGFNNGYSPDAESGMASATIG